MKWILEEYKFKDMTNAELYAFKSDLSMDEKLNILEENGKTFVIKNIELRDKFLHDAESGEIKNPLNFKSVNAWRMRNGFSDSSKWYGSSFEDVIYLRKIDSWTFPSVYFRLDTPQNKTEVYVNCEFARMLFEFRRDEKQHFLENDEYSILAKELDDRFKHVTSNYTSIYTWWDCKTDKLLISYGHGDRRELTLEEIKELNAFYDDLDKGIEEFYSEKYKKIPNFMLDKE